MRRIDLMTISTAIAVAGMASMAAQSSASAQNARSYCLTGGGGELGRCGYPTFEACRLDGAGYGTCIASERPAWGAPASTAATTAPTAAKRRR
jgi:hypothetical protein